MNKSIFIIAAVALCASIPAYAAPVPTAHRCQQIMDNWANKWDVTEVESCHAWKIKKENELDANVKRCELRTHNEVGECSNEVNAYATLLTHWTIVSEPPAIKPAKGLIGPPAAYPSAEQQAVQERADAARRAARKKAIINSFGNG